MKIGVETALLAKKHGIKNLYKSAFYISLDAVRELCDVIDIFSISLKVMDREAYRKITKGDIVPVLEATKFVAKSNAHLELSQLVVTGLNDTEQEALNAANWIIDNLGNHIPLHYVRFHPDYKYNHVERTDPRVLHRAQKIGKKAGLKHVYIGNLYEENISDTFCHNCGQLLVKRFGVDIDIVGITEDNKCTKCGEASGITFQDTHKVNNSINAELIENFNSRFTNQDHSHIWVKDQNALHINVSNECNEMLIKAVSYPKNGSAKYFLLGKKYSINRCMIVKSNSTEEKIELSFYSSNGEVPRVLSLLDRAHYPVL